MIYNQKGSASRITLFTILGVSAFLAIAVMLLPKGFNDDLSIIGKGKAVVVLTHDKNSMRSLDLMTLLNKVRSDYSAKIEFIVVDSNAKDGQLFSQQQNVNAIVFVFFGPHGENIGTLDNIRGETELRSELDKLSLE